MLSSEIRSRFLEFFKKRGHAILPSASLVPENDPSVLFNTAGMQPLVPYLMGQKHPLGTKLASCQKCVRTGDLDDIGDNRHFSFFEMLGNWSLGDYFKQEAISWSYEFLTSEEEGLGLDPARLAVTIFEGDANAPFDQESKDIWMNLGIPEHRIYPLGADDNWWSPGDNGPCGPCSEMFYDMNGDFIGQEISKESFVEQVKKETFIEIWNDVFMEYEKSPAVILIDGMGSLYDDQFNLNQELVNFLEKTKNRKILVVNGNHEKAKEILKDFTIEVFEQETGLKKDNPDFFNSLSMKLGVDLSKCIYFDCNEQHTSCAKDVGLHAVKVSTDPTLIDWLKSRLFVYKNLSQKNVDTGAGLERLTAVMQGKNTAYDTDLFKAVRDAIRIESLQFSGSDFEKQKAERITLDHFRTVIFMASDGVVPSNKDRGYVMRRLTRRGVVYFQKIISSSLENYKIIFDRLIESYGGAYPEILEVKKMGYSVIFHEIEQFQKTLHQGLRVFDMKTSVKNLDSGEKIVLELNGQNVFDLWTTHGFPPELSIELAKEKKIPFSENAVMGAFKILMERHQEASRSGSEQKFKGGLANTNETTVKLHTAHHLLLAALQEVVDKNIHQRGSNITEERLRMDFSFDRKVTAEELQQVEALVNTWIEAKLPVVRREMPREEAEKLGAEMEFGAKYPDIVSVYEIAPSTRSQSSLAQGDAISIEFCGGPHVTNTSEIGTFKIQKEEASSAGVRRIKAMIG